MRPVHPKNVILGLSLIVASTCGLLAGEIARYEFANNLLDSSGNNLHATPIGGSFTSDRFGTPGEAVSLDGVDDYIKIPNYDWEEITYEFWISVGDNLSEILLEKSIDDRSIGAEIEVTAAIGPDGFPGAIDARTGYGFNSYNRIRENDEVILEDTYHHIAYAISRTGTMAFYVDGVLIGSEVPVVATNRFNTETLIGHLEIPNGPYLEAVIDQIIIYDVKMSAAEVLTRYQAGSVPPDSDGDGVRDDLDLCPDSDTAPTVVIDGCDSGVPNLLNLDGQGCSLSDLLSVCLDSRNHGQYVRCVGVIIRELAREGVITNQERQAIQRCAARADLP